MKHRSTLAPSLLALSVALGIMTGCETLPGIKDGVSLSPDRGALKVAIKGDFSRLRSVQAKIEDIDHIGSQYSVTYNDLGRYPFTVSYPSTAYAGAVNVVQ